MAHRYLHYSQSMVDQGRLYSVSNTNRVASKPAGLWISKEGNKDWETYARRYLSIECLRYVHEVKFFAGIPLLRIETKKALVEFTEKYGCEDSTFNIKWDIVARKYQGIIIAPYQEKALEIPELRWYYGWDCASGCIWNKFAIKELKLISNYWETKSHEAA